MASVETSALSACEADKELDQFRPFLLEIGRRLRLARLNGYVSHCVIGSSAFLIIGRCAAYALPASPLVLLFTWGAVLAVFFIPLTAAVIASARIKYDNLALARYADTRLNLKDRISTAVSVSLSLMEPEFAALIIEDASLSVLHADPSAVVPLGWRKRNTIALLCFLAAGTAILLPFSPLSSVSRPFIQLISGRNGAAGTVNVKEAFNRIGALLPFSSPARTAINARHRPAAASRQNQSIAVNVAVQTKNAAGAVNGGRPSGSQSSRDNKIGQAGSDLDKILPSSQPNQQGGRAAAPAGQPLRQSADKSNEQAQNSQNGQTKPSDSSSVPTLGEKLRAFADRLAIRHLTSGERDEASKSLDDVNHKLDGLQMTKTQQKISDAAQDLEDGRQNDAVKDLRAAAYYADHETATWHGQGQQSGGDATSKNAFSVNAKGQDSQASGQNGKQSSSGSTGDASSGNNQQSGGNGSGTGTGAGGDNNSSTEHATGSPNHHQTGRGAGGGTQKPNFGGEHEIDPSKVGHGAAPLPIPLPVSSANGRSFEGDGQKYVSGEQQTSTIPYVKVQTSYKSSKESDTPTDIVPPAYKEIVKKYFSQPAAAR
jgi:hypothetical protein